MRRPITLVLVALLVGSVAGIGAAGPAGSAQSTADCGFPVSAVDATDTEVTVEAEPESIVTLNPSAAQTLWEIGAREKVTGVTKHAMNLEGASERTNISRADQTISHEVVVELDPDLVLAPLSTVTTEEDVNKLRGAGLTVYAYPSADSIEAVRERTLLTGQLVGACGGAEDTVEWMDERIAVVENAVEGQTRPDVLYAFFGYTAGSGTFIHEIIETAGGDNLAADMGIEEYKPLNEEAVLEEDPDWMVLNSDSPTIPDGEGYQQTTAVRENQTVIVDINHLNRPAPRIVYGITALAETFHPDAYAAAQEAAQSTPTPAPTASPTPTATPDTEATESPTPTDAAGPGLGVLAGIAGLIGLALFRSGQT